MTQTYSLADIASHKTRSNLWMAIGGKVYDVTRFVDEVGWSGGSGVAAAVAAVQRIID